MIWFSKKKNDAAPAPPKSGPDWSHVDTREKADALVARGELVQLQLLPAALGGDLRQPNLAYVPPFVVGIKNGIDKNTIMPLVEEGKIHRYATHQEYEGSSFVPAAIVITATEPANFTARVSIWGKAIAEGE